MPSSPRPLVRVAAAALAVAAFATAPTLAAQKPIGVPFSASNRHVAANPIPAGKAYWQCKTDCVVKYDKVADARAGNTPPPAPAIVPVTAFRPVPPQAVRRARAVMEDVMFQALDKSDRGDSYRFGRPNGTPLVRKGGN